MFDHRATARAGLRIVGQPHPRAGGCGRIQCAQARIQRLVVGADRHQHDGKNYVRNQACETSEASPAPSRSSNINIIQINLRGNSCELTNAIDKT